MWFIRWLYWTAYTVVSVKSDAYPIIYIYMYGIAQQQDLI